MPKHFALDFPPDKEQNGGVKIATTGLLVFSLASATLAQDTPAPSLPAPATEESSASETGAPASEGSPSVLPTRPCEAAAVSPSPAPTGNEEAPKKGLQDAYKGIVKIEAANQSPDFATPWQTGDYGQGHGTGFMVAPGLFMTNAHVVANAHRIYIAPYADPRKIPAHVKHVAHDADLALVEVEDKEPFADVPCLQFHESVPNLEDEVRAIGYPIGGNRLSVTRGIVSRIDTISYAHAHSHSHLAVQVDAAINPGNSGGPVLLGNKVAGVAFQGLRQANSTGYMIPIPVIKRFLKDIEDGRYDGYVELGARFFPLVNPAIRRHFNLPDNAKGVLVGDISQGSGADGPLQIGDIVMAVNGQDVDSSGMIELEGERVNMEELAERSFSGDIIRFLILRDGDTKEVDVKLSSPPRPDLMERSYDESPRYVEYGGLVFQPLKLDVISANKLAPSDFLVDMEDYMTKGGFRQKEDIIVLTSVLPDEVNARFSDYGQRIVSKVNGQNIRGLEDLARTLYPERNAERPPFTVIELKGAARPLIFDNAAIDAANARIRASYNVPSAVSL